ncbi:nadsyn1 [Symbiodinium natans]|uniref:Nadsyn1 protein n=1 Tax=Symbiodinium natans TaxID=878477 RepID=A0A812V5C4_9DINO|nr:nadsyn1 [Symbiodinium natans]
MRRRHAKSHALPTAASLTWLALASLAALTGGFSKADQGLNQNAQKNACHAVRAAFGILGWRSLMGFEALRGPDPGVALDFGRLESTPGAPEKPRSQMLQLAAQRTAPMLTDPNGGSDTAACCRSMRRGVASKPSALTIDAWLYRPRPGEEWDEWVAEGKKSPFLGPYVPSDPEAMYAEEWQGWEDFLGCILSFQEARLISRMLGLRSQEDWYAFVEDDPVRLRSLRLPALPSIYYKSEWKGYEDWLALPNETLFVPKGWTTEGSP